MEQFDFWETLDKPKWMEDKGFSPSYVTLMGSRAYGNATEESDYDFYGFCVPPLEVIFPHTTGDIPLFGKKKNVFKQLQLQHILSNTYKEVDMTIYNISYYFDRVMAGNPNMLDSLFVPEESIVVMDRIGSMVRDSRHIFLSQELWSRFKGMAHSHMGKITSRTREGKRKDIVEQYGYDTKDASHVVRVLLEAQDFLFSEDMDNIAGNSTTISNVRNGGWSLVHLKEFFSNTITATENMLELGMSVLPEKLDQVAVKQLLAECLEEEYGSLQAYGWNIYG